MSTTPAAIRGRVLSRLKALDGRKAVGKVYVDQHIRDEYLALKADLPPDEVYTASAGTITATSPTFTLPTTAGLEYAGGFKVRLRSTNRILKPLSEEEFKRFTDGNQTASGFSRSQWVRFVEGVDQSVTGWVWPINAQDEAYDLWANVVAADTSATDIAAWTLRLGRGGQLALELKVAAAILAAMHPADVETRRLNQAVAKQWALEGATAAYKEYDRLSMIGETGRQMRFES